MALINSIIPPQSFEIIRDQIALILGIEIANQVSLSGNYEIDATVFIQRTVWPNASECDAGPLINVMFMSGDYSNQDITQSQGTYSYFIDVYAVGKTKPSGPGDTRAMLKLQRMMGVIRGILEASQYITLGFVPPYVMGRQFKSIIIDQPDSASADNMVRGRLILDVKVPEGNQTKIAQLIDGSDTKFFIDETAEGYFWINDNY